MHTWICRKEDYDADRMRNDVTSFLPNEHEFHFWEEEQIFECEYHVDCMDESASDENDGSAEHPFKTFNRAEQIAEPGARIVVHPGLYRECVTPKRGGAGPKKMISYEAMPGVIVSGSVVAKNIVPAEHCAHDPRIRLWTIRLDPADFPGYNPFCANNLIHMRVFLELTRENQKNHLARRGVVFIDGKPLEQVENMEDLDKAAGTYFVESNGMIVHCRPFDDVDIREHLVELTAKEQNFAPDEPYLGYIRVKGFHFTHAATGHPFPQRGAVSTYRGNHWIIEDNVIEWSNCLGMDIGNEDPSFSMENLPAEKVHCGNGIWLDCDNDCNRRLNPPPEDNWLQEADIKCWTGAVMCMGADDVWSYNNLIGKCPVGINLNAVFMRMGFGRGGTSRAARVMNNIFYDCEESAIRFEDPNNESDGNLFVSMPPGYLVIHYPMPPKYLNLTAWQRFFEMDLHSADAYFDIRVDEEKYELTFMPSASEPGYGRKHQEIRPSLNPAVKTVQEIVPVSTEELARCDYFGNLRSDMSLPGPFTSMEEGVVINIDPRRKV